MSLSGVSTQSTTSASASIEAAANAKANSALQLDGSHFLQMLVAQIKYQDPLDPQKGSDYVAQLATVTQVEKTIQNGQELSALLSMAQLQTASAAIGRTATSLDGQTTGTIEAVTIKNGESTAQLSDGTELRLNAGVRLSQE